MRRCFCHLVPSSTCRGHRTVLAKSYTTARVCSHGFFGMPECQEHQRVIFTIQRSLNNGLCKRGKLYRLVTNHCGMTGPVSCAAAQRIFVECIAVRPFLSYRQPKGETFLCRLFPPMLRNGDNSTDIHLTGCTAAVLSRVAFNRPSNEIVASCPSTADLTMAHYSGRLSPSSAAHVGGAQKPKLEPLSIPMVAVSLLSHLLHGHGADTSAMRTWSFSKAPSQTTVGEGGTSCTYRLIAATILLARADDRFSLPFALELHCTHLPWRETATEVTSLGRTGFSSMSQV
jgi:hypothetical protein